MYYSQMCALQSFEKPGQIMTAFLVIAGKAVNYVYFPVTFVFESFPLYAHLQYTLYCCLNKHCSTPTYIFDRYS